MSHAANDLDDAAFAKALGNEIRSARARKDRTQEQVYTAIGMSKSAYDKLENGKAGVSRSTAQIRRVAAELQVPTSELIRLAEEALESDRP